MNIMTVLKSKRLKWTGHVARMANVKGKVLPVFQLSTTPSRSIGEWMYSSTHSWPRH